MDETDYLEVEVAYARPDRQSVVGVRVAPGTVVRQALRLSNLVEQFPEIDVASCPLGIFGQAVDENYQVCAGDRIEVYRALERDPRDARRELATRGMTMGGLPGLPTKK